LTLAAAPAVAAEAWRYQMPDGSVGMTDDYGKIPDGAEAIRRVELPDAGPAAESEWGGRLRRWLDERAAAGRVAAPPAAAPATTGSQTADREALLQQANDAAAAAASAREAWRNGPPPAAADGDGASGGGAPAAGGLAGMPKFSPDALSAPRTKELMVLALTATMTSGLLWRALVALVLAAMAVAVWKLAALSDGKRRWAWRIGAIAALACWLALALPPAARAWQVDFAELVDAWQAPPKPR
jgi:hypothetical protein